MPRVEAMAWRRLVLLVPILLTLHNVEEADDVRHPPGDQPTTPCCIAQSAAAARVETPILL